MQTAQQAVHSLVIRRERLTRAGCSGRQMRWQATILYARAGTRRFKIRANEDMMEAPPKAVTNCVYFSLRHPARLSAAKLCKRPGYARPLKRIMRSR